MKKSSIALFSLAMCWLGMLTIFISRQHQKTYEIEKIESETIRIDSTFDAIQDTSYLVDLEPTKQMLDSMLSEVIGVCPEKMVAAYLPESPLLNWAADATFEMAKRKYNGQVDMAVTNVGGLRSEIPAGNVTLRTMFDLMPFENQLVVLKMEGKDILELADVFAKNGGQGIAGMTMEIKNGKAQNVQINGMEIVEDAIYGVATSDYLSKGTDGMQPLTKALECIETGALLRDSYIEYVRTSGKMEGKIDGRTKVK